MIHAGLFIYKFTVSAVYCISIDFVTAAIIVNNNNNNMLKLKNQPRGICYEIF